MLYFLKIAVLSPILLTKRLSMTALSEDSDWICFEPRARCQGVAREMSVTPAVVAYDSRQRIHKRLVQSKLWLGSVGAVCYNPIGDNAPAAPLNKNKAQV